jgi:DNA invertase Pin-like site-specific DNA recombinase
MLTVAYCRVSTEEQAEEGFSIEGQADKLRVYAELHDLGDVVVITDPGLSGKNLERPGLQRILEMVAAGHVGHVLVWRLDRLSRNLGDLIALADTFGQNNVALHSFTERLDLSTATGRMFYNVLGSFAQFYREQLGENVRMGMHQAIRQGRWINRAKTGYDMRDGVLVPNEQAALVREIFARTFTALRRITKHPIVITEVAAAESGGSKAEWITELFRTARRLGARGVIWFDLDKEADWRVTSSPEAAAAFHAAATGLPARPRLPAPVVTGPFSASPADDQAS